MRAPRSHDIGPIAEERLDLLTMMGVTDIGETWVAKDVLGD